MKLIRVTITTILVCALASSATNASAAHIIVRERDATAVEQITIDDWAKLGRHFDGFDGWFTMFTGKAGEKYVVAVSHSQGMAILTTSDNAGTGALDLAFLNTTANMVATLDIWNQKQIEGAHDQ